MSTKRSFKNTLTVVLAMAGMTMWAAEPSGYYSTCENKGGAALLTALKSKIGSHTTVSYDGLWNVYKTSDVHADGKVWDMYSTKDWPTNFKQCGNYKNVGDCINREHSFPKSWFNEGSPMKSDAFHVYPTDGKVNGQRSNYPYGECAGGTTLPANGNVKALGKLGNSTFSGYSGKVFEPDDEYKGDFARTYFYMAAAYNDRIAGWNSEMLAGNSYPAYKTWAVNVLLKWHRQDPVSQKELDRNDAVYKYPNNRNPFIDHPEMAEYIWGDRKDQQWSLNATADPEFVLPAKGTVIDMGTCAVGVARSKSVTVKGVGLTAQVGVSVNGAGFSVTPSSLTAASATSANGAQVTVSYTGTTAGNASGVLLIQSGSLTASYTITAKAVDGLPVSAPTGVSDRSFVAHWTNIGDADASGNYTLTLMNADGSVLQTYSVKAADEEYVVNDLEPLTTYTYKLTTGKGTDSEIVNVTTMEPIPDIQFLYDGDLNIEAEPGEPSEAYELVMDVENISGTIVLTVSAPFEISSDRDNWSRTLSVDASEDRFFIRVNSANAGTFTTTLIATAGEYTNDETEITANVAAAVTFKETFESDTPGGSGYNNNGATVQGVMGQWDVQEAGVYGNASEAYNGKNYMRTSKKDNSVFTTHEPKTKGIGVVKFYASAWADAEKGDVDIQTSADGSTWTTAATVTIDGAKSYKPYTVTVNKGASQYLRFQQKSGQRLMFDDIEASDYRDSSGIDGVESDYRSWTAVCLDHQLVVDLAKDSIVRVYGMDGIMYHDGAMGPGRTALALPMGLYIVAVDDFARRVLVK